MDEDLLRVWDVDKGEAFQLHGRGVIQGGLPPKVVRQRHPKIFAWAQELGYWTDVQIRYFCSVDA